MDEDELTPDEIDAFADAFPVGPAADTVLRNAKYPAAMIPVTGFRTSGDFWSLIAGEIANGVMHDGRRKLLAAARRRYPRSTRFADPDGPGPPAAPAGSTPAAPAGGWTVAGGQGVQIGGGNVQNNNYYYGAAPQSAQTATTAPDRPPPPAATAALRVLMLGASPSGRELPYARASREALIIDAAARPGRIEVATVVRAAAADVAEVRAFRPDILHFVCRGERDRLVFSDARGQADPVKADRIVDMLRRYRTADDIRLRAIVLAGCDGAPLVPWFTEVADVVVGHRGGVAGTCGEAFARHFYRLLGDSTRDTTEPRELAVTARVAARLAAQLSDGCRHVIDTLIVAPDAG